MENFISLASTGYDLILILLVAAIAGKCSRISTRPGKPNKFIPPRQSRRCLTQYNIEIPLDESVHKHECKVAVHKIYFNTQKGKKCNGLNRNINCSIF